jgi:dTDP-4-amino-4,6-dideoxygalactose transaminase
MSYYRKNYGLDPEDFPHATERFGEVISLPIYPDLDDDSVDRVIEAVTEIGDASYHGPPPQ